MSWLSGGWKRNVETPYKKALEKHLRPELLARIDEVLFFNDLNDSNLLKIVNQELRLISDRLSERGIELSYSPSVKKYIFNELKEKNSHARQIKNLVKTLVQIPLSTFIVENRGIEKISLKVVDKTLSFA